MLVVSGRFANKDRKGLEVLSGSRYSYLVRSTGRLGKLEEEYVSKYIDRYGNEIYLSLDTPVKDGARFTQLKVSSPTEKERATLKTVAISTLMSGIEDHRGRVNGGEDFIHGCAHPTDFLISEGGNQVYKIGDSRYAILTGKELREYTGEVHNVLSKTIDIDVLEHETLVYLGNEDIPYICMHTPYIMTLSRVDGAKTKTIPYQADLSQYQVHKKEAAYNIDAILGRISKENIEIANAKAIDLIEAKKGLKELEQVSMLEKSIELS